MLIPPATRGKFEPEWQTNNHYVDGLAPLNRYLFIYLFIYLLIYLSLVTRGIDKEKFQPPIGLSGKRKVVRNSQLH